MRLEGARAYEDGCGTTFPQYTLQRSAAQGEGTAMANLLIRNLDDAVLRRLTAAAKRNRCSVEDEIRASLRMAAIRHAAETRRLSSSWLEWLRRTQV